MDIFDIVGPIMVGPSSSHTAGATKIGYVAGKLLGEKLRSAKILLYGSFLATGKGHGTHKAIVAGLLGMRPDDYRISDSLSLAKENGIDIEFGEAKLHDAHPNTAQLFLTGENGNTIEVVAESVGGGKINVSKIDGIDTGFSGDYPTLIVHNEDTPGHVSEVTSMLASRQVNIANMQICRSHRGGKAVMVVECDQHVPQDGIEMLKNAKGVLKVTYFEGV